MWKSGKGATTRAPFGANNRSVQLKEIEMGLTISILDHVYCPNFWLISHYILVITNIWHCRMFSEGMDLTFVFVCCPSNNGVRLVGGPDYPGSRPQLNPTGGLRCSSPLAFKTGDMRFADNSGQLWVSCWYDCVPTSFGRKEGWWPAGSCFCTQLYVLSCSRGTLNSPFRSQNSVWWGGFSICMLPSMSHGHLLSFQPAGATKMSQSGLPLSHFPIFDFVCSVSKARVTHQVTIVLQIRGSNFIVDRDKMPDLL